MRLLLGFLLLTAEVAAGAACVWREAVGPVGIRGMLLRQGCVRFCERVCVCAHVCVLVVHLWGGWNPHKYSLSSSSRMMVTPHVFQALCVCTSPLSGTKKYQPAILILSSKHHTLDLLNMLLLA